MKPDISEFSYGYAVTHELASKYKLISAPEFPTLYKEGKKGGGYDVKLPFKLFPLFLQFKLSDCLEKTSAKEHRPRHFEVPYFRMHLRPLKHSLQHNLLLELEASGSMVYYIAPAFYKTEEFNHFYLKNSILSNSVLISPHKIGALPDDDDHYVVFKAGAKKGYFCSDNPQEISLYSIDDALGPIKDEFKNTNRMKSAENFFRELSEKMVSVIEQVELKQKKLSNEEAGIDIAGLRALIDQKEPEEACAYISRTIFNSELVIIGR